MSRLVFADAPQNVLLAQDPNTAFNCPLFYTKNIGQNSGRDKWICLHVPENLKRERVQIGVYTDIHLLDFGIYTDTAFSYPNVFVSLSSITQDIVDALLEKTLNELQPFR